MKAYEKLHNEYGCSDPRISIYNVLMLRAYKFERIFVFYNGNKVIDADKVEIN